MSIYDTADLIENCGYWMTYHHLTDAYRLPRRQALWMMWIARQYMLHRNGRSFFERILDRV
jgi:hypothetical protein